MRAAPIKRTLMAPKSHQPPLSLDRHRLRLTERSWSETTDYLFYIISWRRITANRTVILQEAISLLYFEGIRWKGFRWRKMWINSIKTEIFLIYCNSLYISLNIFRFLCTYLKQGVMGVMATWTKGVFAHLVWLPVEEAGLWTLAC